MKKSTLFAAFFMLAQMVFAGGILTNTNQSAQFVRMLSRNASTQIDAVYFNPAGLMKMDRGFHIAIHNQSIFQTRTIVTQASVNNPEFTGDVAAPWFPSLFAAYKTDNFAVSFGFGPNGGGGSAKYKNGLPSFEKQIAALPGLISSMGVPTTAYDVDIHFEGSSVFWGAQLGFAYALNDYVSLSAGVRYLPSVNTYKGSIKNIRVNPQHPLINPGGAMMFATDFLEAAAPQYLSLVTDREVDTKQTGAGWTPILGVNISLSDKLNIGLKYEHSTVLRLTNDTKKSDAGMEFLRDGAEIRTDLPGLITAGIGYNISDDLKASLSFNEFLDKNINWGNNIYEQERIINKNLWELALGFQYNISESFAVSIGGMQSTSGVSEQYQSDFSFHNSSNSGALGFEWKISDVLTLDAGILYTAYKDEDKSFGNYSETYGRENKGFAIGLSYSMY